MFTSHATGEAPVIPDGWEMLIADFVAYLAAIGRPATTIALRRRATGAPGPLGGRRPDPGHPGPGPTRCTPKTFGPLNAKITPTRLRVGVKVKT